MLLDPRRDGSTAREGGPGTATERALRAENARLRAAVERLRRYAFIDELTGLANQRAFATSLVAETRRARRDGVELTLMLCDVDDFKGCNDTLGHRQGDATLSCVGAVLQSFARRAGDVAARCGGDEFALILPGLNAGDAVALAARVGRAVAAAIAGTSVGHCRRVTVSLGVATQRAAADCDEAALFDAADAALYDAKAAGGNCARYREPGAEPTRRREQLEAATGDGRSGAPLAAETDDLA